MEAESRVEELLKKRAAEYKKPGVGKAKAARHEGIAKNREIRRLTNRTKKRNYSGTVAGAGGLPVVMEEAAAAAVPDLITPFLTGEYNDIINKPANNLGELLAIADSIHDFGKGYRNLPSQDGVKEADRFLRNGYLPRYEHREKDVLINGYNNIEATNRSFFETRANIPWVASLPKSTISVDTIIAYANLDVVISKAKDSRNTNSSIEISPGATTISSLAKPDDHGTLSADQLVALKKLEVFILTFLFGDPDAPCYFASDAGAKNVGKILSQSTSASGIIFPQTIADSATTSLGGSLTRKADRYYFPHDPTDKNTFTSTANNFTNDIFKITYKNKGFSDDKPYAWEQTITSNAAVGGTGEGSPPSANLQYGLDTGVEGPSVDQLLQLQVKTRNNSIPPSVRISKGSQFDLARSIGPIYSEIRKGVVDITHSLYMDIKRCGDQDQCLAVSYTRRDPEFNGRVALITGDITCAIKNRCYDNPTVEHYNDRIRLYRSSKTERLLSETELLILQYKKLVNEIKQYEPIIIFFLNESRSTTFIDSVPDGNDDKKIKDLKQYLAGAGAGGVVEHGLKTPIVFTEITGSITLLEVIDVSDKTDEVLKSINTSLDGLVTTYRKIIDNIIRATSVTSTPSKTLEFLEWYVAHAADTFDTTKIYPELQYDPDNKKPSINASWNNYMGVTAPYDIIEIIDTYNNKLIEWCNSFFNQGVANKILAENLIAFKGESDSIEQLKQLINRLYSITLKSNIKNYEGLVVTHVLPMWKLAVSKLIESSDPSGAGIMPATLNYLERDIEERLKDFPDALYYILDRSPPPRGSKPMMTALGAVRAVRPKESKPMMTALGAVQAVQPRRISQRLAAAGAGGNVGQQTGVKRHRGGGQIGGAACITRIDIVDELYDFFGTVAAIFRTKVYDTFPAAGSPTIGEAVEINSNVDMGAVLLPTSPTPTSPTRGEAVEVNSNVDMIAAPPPRGGIGGVNENGYNNLIMNEENAFEPLTFVEQILYNTSLQGWATENMYVYEQLFNELVLDKFNKQELSADCSDYKELLDIISNLFFLRDGKEALKFYILITVIDDLLGKKKSPLIKHLIPNIGRLSIEILSNRGVKRLNEIIEELLKLSFIIPEPIRRHYLGGGRRRTQRRYSMRQYKKRSATTARRHRRRTETRSNRGRN